MTENEAVLRDIIIDGNGFDYDESIPQSIFEEIQQYRAIGTIDEFKALKEKNEPKKPIEYYKCPTCKEYAVDNVGGRYKYCPNCGTKIDWQ